jgi:transcriptional regulator with XRE-family HTH domain
VEKMNIGQRIKQRRLELNLSQDELAKKVGYKSRSSINKIELSRDLPLKKVELMAKALETTPSYLMGWNDINVTGIGRALKELTHNSDLELAYLSRNANIPKPVLDDIINDNCMVISIDLLTKIADYFNVGISYLLRYNTQQLPSDFSKHIYNHDIGAADNDMKLADFLLTMGYDLSPVANTKDYTLTKLETKEVLEISNNELALFKRTLKHSVDNCVLLLYELNE